MDKESMTCWGRLGGSEAAACSRSAPEVSVVAYGEGRTAWDARSSMDEEEARIRESMLEPRWFFGRRFWTRRGWNGVLSMLGRALGLSKVGGCSTG